jgi:hypothetical protein
VGLLGLGFGGCGRCGEVAGDRELPADGLMGPDGVVVVAVVVELGLEGVSVGDWFTVEAFVFR